MDRRWVVKPFDEERIDQLQTDLGISRILCQLLVQRGISTYDTAQKFFRHSLDYLYDPFLMKDMDLAITRIEQAILNKEKIIVYGDYDVDGTTAVALVYSFFSEFYDQMEYYIPDRYEEGYGISYQGIDYAKENGFSLIIALDCGIKAIDKIAYASEKGVDFIICDHHRPAEVIPSAVAVLDPKREDCEYPYKELSGCGIGFKLIQAFAQKGEMPFERVASYLDLVVVSIAADIVPVTDENRILAYFGLKQLNTNPRPGIKALIDVSGIEKEIQISDIVFVIAPRINAAGRMGHANKAVRLLVSKELRSADLGASLLNEKNTERKTVDRDITEEALSMIHENEDLRNRKSTVLYRPHWHKGVIGIVASRVIDYYYRPTIILTESGDMAAGSARSVSGFDVYNAIKECEDLLDQFGGHKYAAGLTIKKENIPLFTERFEKVVASTIKDEMLIPEIMIDAEVEISTLTENFYKILAQFAPFGPGNMRPVLYSTGLTDTGWSSIVGQEKNHIRLHVRQNGYVTKGIAFNQSAKQPIIKADKFDLCYTLRMNEWRGNKSVQMQVKDIKATNDASKKVATPNNLVAQNG